MGSISSFLRPRSSSTLISMGRPWQSQPGHVGSVKAAHGPRLDDEIFQRLIERGAQVNWPVGVGRPVMQHINRLALMGLADALVEPHRLPLFQLLGLALRQVRLHWEVGLGQIQCGLQVERHSGFLPFKPVTGWPKSYRLSLHYRERANLRPTAGCNAP